MNMVDDLHRADMFHVSWTTYRLVRANFSKSWSTKPPEKGSRMGCGALAGALAVQAVVRAVTFATTFEICCV